MLSDKPVVFSAKRISKDFGAGKTLKTAVKDVSFDIYDEEFISIVGGSGCGKSVLAKIMLGLYKPTRGQFLYRDKPIKNLKEHWNEVQSVFQDPFGCFNQFFTIRSQLEDSLNILKNKPSKDEIRRRVDATAETLGLTPYLDRLPKALSGGQRQRVALARCIITEPRLIIADEPIASLDISIQAQIVMLCKRLQEEKHFAFLFIAHDLSMIRFISDRVGVMLHGRIVEVAEAGELFRCPLHPYTKSLLSAIHIPDPLLERKKALIHYDTGTRLGETLCEVSPGHYLITD